jgi:putative membrane protein
MPVPSVFWSTWHLDPVAGSMIVVAAVVYGRWVVVARRTGGRWSPWRSIAFGTALALFGVVQFGIVGRYSAELRWAFTLRLALLFFAVPTFAALGAPLALARLGAGPRVVGWIDTVMGTRAMRILGTTIVSALIPLGMFGLLLLPVSAPLRTSEAVGVALTVLVPLVGFVLLAPTMEPSVVRSATFLTIEFLLVFVELMVDATPALVMRVNDVVLDGATRAMTGPAWFPTALRDQHLAGDLLIFIAEMADLPVLISLIVLWQRADRREAKAIDAVSDEEMAALTEEHLRRFSAR